MMNGGKHINDRRLIYTKTSFLEVDAPEQVNRLMINLDGEYGGDAPMRFENLHNHIEFLQMSIKFLTMRSLVSKIIKR